MRTSSFRKIKKVSQRAPITQNCNRWDVLTYNFHLPSMRPHPDACFDLQFCHSHLCNYNPQIVNTNNRATTGFLISKLWVKTRTLRTGNRVTPTPQIPQSWNNVLFTFAGEGLDCSERVTSQWIFVLTLNRASALKVEDNEQNFLLRQIIVATIKRIGLESKRSQLWQYRTMKYISCYLYISLQPQKGSV